MKAKMKKIPFVEHEEEIIVHVRRLRSSLYPADYDADPWLLVEKELEELLGDMKQH